MIKKLKNITVALCTTLMLAACSSEGPEVAAENFQRALMSGNFSQAAKYASKKTIVMLEQLANMVSAEQAAEMEKEMQGVTLNVIGKEINEDKTAAAVVLEITSIDGDMDTSSLSLIKEDESWKVDYK